MRRGLLIFLGGAGSVSLGLAYVLQAFGPTEAEVRLWGQVAICLGFALVPLTVCIRYGSPRVIKGIASLGWGIVALLQVLPILLWFTFHGAGISDGTPTSSFMAHWMYAIPHVVVLATSVSILWGTWARPKPGSRLGRWLSC